MGRNNKSNSNEIAFYSIIIDNYNMGESEFVGKRKPDEKKAPLLVADFTFVINATISDFHHNHADIKDKDVLAFLHRNYKEINGKMETVETWLAVAEYNNDQDLRKKLLEFASPEERKIIAAHWDNITEHIRELKEGNARIAELAEQVKDTKTNTPKRAAILASIIPECNHHAETFKLDPTVVQGNALEHAGNLLRSDMERGNLLNDALKAGFAAAAVLAAATAFDKTYGSNLVSRFGQDNLSRQLAMMQTASTLALLRDMQDFIAGKQREEWEKRNEGMSKDEREEAKRVEEERKKIAKEQREFDVKGLHGDEQFQAIFNENLKNNLEDLARRTNVDMEEIKKLAGIAEGQGKGPEVSIVTLQTEIVLATLNAYDTTLNSLPPSVYKKYHNA